MKKEVWFILGFLVLGIVGAIIVAVSAGNSSNATTYAVNATVVPPLIASDWVEGNRSGKVSVIEYGDFQCPACGEFESIWDQLVKTYGDRVAFSFRNFPLYQVHPNAGISAQAAEAAGLQGKYWEMHNLLYAKQNDWADVATGDVAAKYFDPYASSLGLDVARFNSDITSDAVKNKVDGDVATANGAQVDHTPTFFVNLKQIVNPTSYNEFKSVIDNALASS